MGDDPPANQHRRHGADATRRHHQARGLHRVVSKCLQPRRHQRRTGHQDRAGREHHQDARAEIAVLEDRGRDEWPLGGQHMHDEQIKPQAPQHGLDNDFVGCEPILVLAAVQHHLDPADTQRQHAETNPVEAHVEIGMRARQENHETQCRENPERQIDIEHEPPVVQLGQVTAPRRPQDRPDHDPDAPDRHGLTAALDRVDVHHRRLRQGHQCRAKHTLQHAEHHHLLQRLRGAAHHRCRRESDQAGDIQVFAAEPGRQPAHGRGHDRRRGDV